MLKGLAPAGLTWIKQACRCRQGIGSARTGRHLPLLFTTRSVAAIDTSTRAGEPGRAGFANLRAGGLFPRAGCHRARWRALMQGRGFGAYPARGDSGAREYTLELRGDAVQFS